MGTKGFKRFNKGMICKDKQYAENSIFEEPSAELCEKGMHFCENPLDTLKYYPLIDDNGDLTDFAEVEALDEVLKDGDKCCTKKLKIGAKLDLMGFIHASVNYMRETIAKGTNSKMEAGGDYSRLAGGDYSRLAGGRHSRLVGGYGSRLAGGDGSQLVGGYGSQLVGGYGSQLAGGDDSRLVGGYYSQLVGGDGSQLAGGRNAVIVGSTGSTAKGKTGSLIVLVDRDDDGNIVDFAASVVDGENIKADVLYKLDGGKLVEVE